MNYYHWMKSNPTRLYPMGGFLSLRWGEYGLVPRPFNFGFKRLFCISELELNVLKAKPRLNPYPRSKISLAMIKR